VLVLASILPQEAFMPGSLSQNVQSQVQRLCAKASGAIVSQASEHDADHGKVDPGFLAAGEHLIIFGEPTPGREPGESTLNDPTTLPPNTVFCF
jgi:hypothetical protein